MRNVSHVLMFVILIATTAFAEQPSASTAPATVAAANNAFALDLYAKLSAAGAAKDKNLFFSPFSISTALAMTYCGARNDTALEMSRTLHLGIVPPPAFETPNWRPFQPQQVASNYRQFLSQLNDEGKERNFELHAANSLWAQKDFEFLPAYLDLVTKNFDSSLDKVDFKTDAEAARTKINQWVEKKTNDKIKDLIPAGGVDAATRLVLVNAIYFKAAWLFPFEQEMTKERALFTSFRKSDSGPVWNTSAVPMMTQTHHFRYVEKNGVQAIELPYKSGNLAMIVLLPPQAYKPEIIVGPGVEPTPPPPADQPMPQLSDFEKMLTSEKLNAILAGLKDTRVEVHLPKWKMTCPFALSKTLQDMGMKQAFTPAADLSGMTGRNNVFISEVVHKAFIAVDEKGTEAAAATAVMVAANGHSSPPQPPVVFRADHPFIFLIRDTKSGAILFMGRVIDPAAK